MIPKVWLKGLGDKFISTYNIKIVKTEVFTLKRMNFFFVKFKLKIFQFKDLVSDLVNYSCLRSDNGNKYNIYLKGKSAKVFII